MSLFCILFVLFLDHRAVVSINVTLSGFLEVDNDDDNNNATTTLVDGNNNSSSSLDNMLVSQTINALIKEMSSFCNDNHINCDLVYKLLRERISTTTTSSSSSCSWIDQNLVLIVVIVVLKLIILGMSSLLARSHCLKRTARGNVDNDNDDDEQKRTELKELVVTTG